MSLEALRMMVRARARGKRLERRIATGRILRWLENEAYHAGYHEADDAKRAVDALVDVAAGMGLDPISAYARASNHAERGMYIRELEEWVRNES